MSSIHLDNLEVKMELIDRHCEDVQSGDFATGRPRHACDRTEEI